MTTKFAKKMTFPRTVRTMFIFGVIWGLSGCVSMPRSTVEPAVDKIRESAGTTGPMGFADSVIEVDAGYDSEDMFLLRPLNSTGNLPDKQIAPFDINERGIFDTLRILIAGTGLTLKIEGGLQGSEAYGSATMFDVHGSLKDVIENLSESMGFFYSVRKNTLLIYPEQQFVVSLPPALADDNTAGITNTLQYLGAKDTYIDRMAGTLVFKANRSSLEKIEQYVNKIRETRSMIVYAINIFQVDLTDNSDMGIQWNRLGYAGPNAPVSSSVSNSFTSGQTGVAGATTAATTNGTNTSGTSTGTTGTTGATSTTNTTGSTTGSTTVGTDATNAVAQAARVGAALQAGISGTGLGVVLSTARFTVDNLVSFLKTQGTVSTLSQPRIAILNNTTGTLSVGRTTTYVSKSGAAYSSAVSSVLSETQNLDTGVDLQLRGETSDNTVTTTLDMKVTDLISLTQVPGTAISTPDVAKRKVNNIIRTTPGEIFIMGGITLSKDSRTDTRGLATNGYSKTVTKSELVLALRTQVINFLPRGEKERRAAAARRGHVEIIPVNDVPSAPAPRLPKAPLATVPVQAPMKPVASPVKTDTGRGRTPEPQKPPVIPAESPLDEPPTPGSPGLQLRMSGPKSDAAEDGSNVASTGNLPLAMAMSLSSSSLARVAADDRIDQHYLPLSIIARAEVDRRASGGEIDAAADTDMIAAAAAAPSVERDLPGPDTARASFVLPERESAVAQAVVTRDSDFYATEKTPPRYASSGYVLPSEVVSYLSIGK